MYKIFLSICLLFFSDRFSASLDTSINPKSVWEIVNETLRLKKSCPHCPNLVFHNRDAFMNETLFEDKLGQFHHHPSSFINVRELVHPEGFTSSLQDDLEDIKARLKTASEFNIKNGDLQPCINVISIVNSTAFQVQEKDKVVISRVLMELLQFQTPIRARHLILLRLSDDADELTPCYPRQVPIRKVPLWEMILFDFFTDARVIQNDKSWEGKPILKVTKESGKWRWYCNDIIEPYKLEKKCKGEKKCEEQEHWTNISKDSSEGGPWSCQTEYAPRQ